jgi:hypothetical protein
MANEKFVCRLSGLADDVNFSGKIFVVTGKQEGGSLSSGTANDEIGVYDSDGLGSYTSSSFFTTDNVGYKCMLIDKGNGSPLNFIAYFASAPTKGTHTINNNSRYLEDPDDDGISVQDSSTWYKYELA